MYVKVDYSTKAKKNPRVNMAGEWAKTLEQQDLKYQDGEVVKIQEKPKFKVGDILTAILSEGSKSVFFYKDETNDSILTNACYNSGFFYYSSELSKKNAVIRQATQEERLLLCNKVAEISDYDIRFT